MTTWNYQEKAGLGSWDYDEADLTYDQDQNADGLDVRYDAVGTETSWDYPDKS